MDRKNALQLLSGNQLKLLALITMTMDHMGMIFFPYDPIWRIIGRFAFPIFAWFIAEGCRYTRNRKKYLLTMVALAAICQLVYLVVLGSLYQCVLVTFSLAICWIFALDRAIKKPCIGNWILALGVSLAVVFVSVVLPRLLGGTDFEIDYGFWGVLLPVLVYVPRSHGRKLLVAGLVLLSLCLSMGNWVQWFSLLTLIPLALYSGKRGKGNLKYLFYVYYPLHLAALYGVSMLIGML